MILPFKGSFKQSQGFNDKCCRASYARFGLMGHNGIDYACPTGTEILAPHGGKVLEATNDPSGYGLYIKIENEFEGSLLAHLKSFSVKLGETVVEGQSIGISNNTGNSTGPHLHWGYYRMPRNKDNGFNGYVDQTLFMNFRDTSKLEEELIEMRASRDKWKLAFKEEEEKHAKEILEKNKDYERLQATLSETNFNLSTANTQVAQLRGQLEDLDGALEVINADYAICMGELKHKQEVIEIQGAELEDLEKDLKKKLKDFSLWDFLKAKWGE